MQLKTKVVILMLVVYPAKIYAKSNNDIFMRNKLDIETNVASRKENLLFQYNAMCGARPCIIRNVLPEFSSKKKRNVVLYDDDEDLTLIGKCFPGHFPDSRNNDQCSPLCSEPCVNAECGAPEWCSCNTGYLPDPLNQYQCNLACTKTCINAVCTAPETCSCNAGYLPDLKNKYQCNPGCLESCNNGVCMENNKCICNSGYKMVNGTCNPVCNSSCENGFCSNPGVCRCLHGYEKNNKNINECLPLCVPNCINGYCSKPGQCKCEKGLFLDIDNVTCKASQESCLLECFNGICKNGICILSNKAEFLWLISSCIGGGVLLIILLVSFVLWQNHQKRSGNVRVTKNPDFIVAFRFRSRSSNDRGSGEFDRVLALKPNAAANV